MLRTPDEVAEDSLSSDSSYSGVSIDEGIENDSAVQESAARPAIAVSVREDDAVTQADVRPAVEEASAANNNVGRPVNDGSHVSQSSGSNTENELLTRRVELLEEMLRLALLSRPTGNTQARFVVFLY